ncbi:MAG: flagellin [Rhodothermaceae bacterium]|nr:flagellin [Rhodothermaceae bacterium]
MAFGDLTRVNTNIQSMQSLFELQKSNADLGMRQLRLATGRRINRAEDDSAGLSIAMKLESRIRGQAQALANIGDAKSMLNVAEGGLSTIQEILMTMKEKVIQGANDSLSSFERGLINNQLNFLSTEINSIVSSSTFNGVTVFSSGAFSFQVGSASSDTFSVTVGALSTGTLGVSSTSLSVTSATSAGSSLSAIDTAINTIASTLGNLGDNQLALSFKEENLNINMVNQESARSRILDADFAKEQIEIVKLQILQQTGVAALSQANLAPQVVLSLL